MVDKENPRSSGESLHSLAGESEIAAEIERMLYEPADSSGGSRRTRVPRARRTTKHTPLPSGQA